MGALWDLGFTPPRVSPNAAPLHPHSGATAGLYLLQDYSIQGVSWGLSTPLSLTDLHLQTFLGTAWAWLPVGCWGHCSLQLGSRQPILTHPRMDVASSGPSNQERPWLSASTATQQCRGCWPGEEWRLPPSPARFRPPTGQSTGGACPNCPLVSAKQGQW